MLALFLRMDFEQVLMMHVFSRFKFILKSNLSFNKYEVIFGYSCGNHIHYLIQINH